MKTLILFDIDATLLLTRGSGMAAMQDAGRELFGAGFSTDGTDFAGRLDPLLFRELLDRHGVEHSPENVRRYREVYGRALKTRLSTSTAHRAMPGTVDLVLRLRERAEHALGILTGNFAETGSMKLRACGFDPEWFKVSVWGDDSPHDPPARDHLPVVAFERFEAAYGSKPGSTTIIGDTPHDIRCARVNGCRSLGVATGKFTVHELEAAGADRVVADMSDVAEIERWLNAR